MSHATQKSHHTPRNLSSDQLLQRMPPEVVSSLTPTQLEAFRSAFRGVQAGNHAHDLRLTIPFPGRGFYIVLLGGRERRSIQRLRAENMHHPYSTLFGSLALLSLLAAITVPSILWLVRVNAEGQQSEIQPTAIPWLQDRQSCEATDRTWQDDKCWDQEWSHMF
ncbi:MAG: hypothetical protein KME07_22450 [Pegethrix bostrychoides GSE-TBD4-15B]|jgi:hypothetical protein|uniref:Uncharacterized protein n=1 Tax=Pegethrix bostrychoides GSE-TBD4-15B TaxID=2839662 RepID=A0A951U873_9CYAN|nr:hypothetical protein [Pegethrix bostrychoides GSE-TBD4-15B]